MKISLTVMVLLVGLSTPLFSQTNYPELDYYDFIKITYLYKEKKYQVVANFLAEKGFRLKYFNEDYTDPLNKDMTITGEMKLEKKEPGYLCDQKTKYDLGTIHESYILFKTEDFTDFTNYVIELNLWDGNCVWDWKNNNRYGNAELLDNLTNPLIRVSKKNLVTKYSDHTSANFEDTVRNYFKSTATGDVSYFPFNTFIWIHDYSATSLKAEFIYRRPKYPIEIPIEEYYRLNSKSSSTLRVPLEKVNGVYHLEIIISGKRVKYILDSGASEMAITESMEKYLQEIGAIRLTDYLPSGSYNLADGSTVTNRRVQLPSVKIGDITLNNVPAYIAKDSSPLLSGKSALDMLAYWKIDNTTNRLEIMAK